MRQIAAIFKREFSAFFVSPVAYIVFLVFYLLASYFFSLVLYYSPTTDLMNYLFGNMVIGLMIISPILTMNVFVKDRQLGTLELLLTSPISIWQLVIGKFLSVFAFFLMLLASTLVYVAVVVYLGSPEWGPILSGYLGVTLVGAGFISVGVFASSLTKNQVVAAVISFGFSLLFWALGWGANMINGSLGKWMEALSILNHFGPFEKGMVTTSDTLFYILFTAFFLILSYHVLWLYRKVGE